MFNIWDAIDEIEFESLHQKKEAAHFLNVALGNGSTYISPVFSSLSVAQNFLARAFYQIHLMIEEHPTELLMTHVLLSIDDNRRPILPDILHYLEDFLLVEKDIHFPRINVKFWREDTISNNAMKFPMHIHFATNGGTPPNKWADRMFYMNIR